MTKIYLDMDGVLADFFGGLEKFYGVNHWKMLKEESILGVKGSNFFHTLDAFDTALDLVNFVKDIASKNEMQWGINSSPLKGDMMNSAYWKRRWLEDHGWMPNVDNLIFTGRKENYAVNKFDGSPNILIDDKPTNLTRWIAKGGIGIRYQANEDDLEYLFPKIKEAVEDVSSGNFKYPN